VSFYSEII